ncbi:MAG TPA: BlaI/MecI/CopY family transcriptional regulator [Blastocatellia bacterium]|nr:BlaI/MecI/CopY family transcriptional regulator [Blastocatellia bacterium]
MTRKKSEHLTPLELEIMKVLWESGPAGVQAVQERLEGSRAYTTVQTMLNVLHRKGKVTRVLQEKAYVYKPAVTRSQAIGNAVGDLVDRMFGGSAESLVMSLVETKRLTPAKLAKLQKLLEKETADEQDK